MQRTLPPRESATLSGLCSPEWEHDWGRGQDESGGVMLQPSLDITQPHQVTRRVKWPVCTNRLEWCLEHSKSSVKIVMVVAIYKTIKENCTASHPGGNSPYRHLSCKTSLRRKAGEEIQTPGIKLNCAE